MSGVAPPVVRANTGAELRSSSETQSVLPLRAA
jgi:hypothetical protein